MFEPLLEHPKKRQNEMRPMWNIVGFSDRSYCPSLERWSLGQIELSDTL